MRISVEEFAKGGASSPRNHVITTLFRRIGVCERAGTGGPQIFSTAAQHKLNIPNFQIENNITKLKIWKVDIADAHPELSENSKNILKLLVKSTSPLGSQDIRSLLDLSKHYFDKSIAELLDSNLIEVEGRSRSTKYALKTESTEHLANLHNMITVLQSYYLRK